jgi:mannosyltransferase OCH1-like enzyme
MSVVVVVLILLLIVFSATTVTLSVLLAIQINNDKICTHRLTPSVNVNEEEVKETIFIEPVVLPYTVRLYDTYRKKLINVQVDDTPDTTNTATKPTLIPKIVHQTYKDSTLPRRMFNAVNGIRERHLDFEHRYYDNDACDKFLATYADKHTREAFHTVIPGAYKADIFRLALLYHLGGIYIDISMCIDGSTSLHGLLTKLNTTDQLVIVKDLPKGAIYQALIATTPRNPIIKYILDKIVDRVLSRSEPPNDVRMKGLWYTGPVAFGQFLNEYLGRDQKTNFVTGSLNDNVYLLSYHKNRIKSLTSNGGIVKDVDGTTVINTKYRHWQHDRSSKHYSKVTQIYK